MSSNVFASNVWYSGNVTVAGTTSLSGTRTVQAFPPSAMTGYLTTLSGSYGVGNYVASASSEYGAVSNPAWYAFDKSGTLWTSNLGYNSTTGAYNAANVTVATTGTAYFGEWLQLQQPVSTVLSTYSILDRGDVTYESPNTFYILGSRDGTSWTLVDSQSGITWSANQTKSFTVSTTQSFNYYRLVTNIINVSGGTPTRVSVGEWVLNGSIQGAAFTADGRVGLGVVNPTRALEVAGDVVCAGTLSAGNPLMFRNALYNGDFRIAQRGTSFPGGGGYLLDRWKISSYGAGGAYYTVSQIQSGLANFSNALQLQQTSTNSMFFFLQQSLETRDVVRFQGQPVTVSFWYKIPTSFTGSIYAQLNWSTAVDTPLTDIGISYTTAGSLTLTNQTAWTYATFTTFVPSTAQALSVMFTNYPPGGSTVNGATIQITGVQLEKGLVATPFEVRPYATELALCQRYFCKTFPYGTAPAQAAGQAGSLMVQGAAVTTFISGSGGQTPFAVTRQFPVEMRANPAVTTYSTNAATANWYDQSGADLTASTTNIGTRTASIYMSGGTTAVGRNAVIHASANAEL